MGKASTRAQNKYNAKNYDRVSLMLPKGRKQAIQGVAAALGESLNGFVTTAIDERIERIEGTEK